MRKKMDDLKAGRAELEERMRQTEQQAREAMAREEGALKRVQELSGKLASSTDATNAEATRTVEHLRTENRDLKATVAERDVAVTRLNRDNAQLLQDTAALRDNLEQRERHIAELKEAGQKLEQEAEHLKLAAQSQPGSMTDESASPEVVQQLQERITELEVRLQKSEKDLQVERIHVEAMDRSLIQEKADMKTLLGKYENKKKESVLLDLACRKLQGSERVLHDELKLRTQQFTDASDAVKHLERTLREAKANGMDMDVAALDLSSAPTSELMDVDGPPELPSPPSSPVTGPIEVCEVRERNRRLSQHNDTLRSGQAKIELEIQALRAENERLQAENARYEPFVLTSEQRDGELEMLTEENAALCRSNERIREEVEELRTLRDRGLLQDLQSASPEGLIPSSELAGMLAQNLTNVFAGIDAVLAETTQRKFTVTDRPQATSTSLSRRQSMVFKQATRPSTPAFSHVGILLLLSQRFELIRLRRHTDRLICSAELLCAWSER